MAIQYYSRKCDKCGEGMEEGYLSESTVACSEKCMRKLLTDEVFEDGIREWEEEGDCEWLFWTDWEKDWKLEEFLYLQDGTQVDNPYFDNELFNKLFKRTNNG